MGLEPTPSSVRLLGEGEVSSAEFMATAFPNVVVKGIDDPNRYKADIGDRAAGAGTIYLVKIAERSMKPDQIAKVNELIKAKKVTEAIDLMIGSDPWTKQKYAQMSKKCPKIVSAGDMVRHLSEVESEARTRNIGIDTQTSEGMQELKKFFQAASERDAPMVRETIALAKSAPKTPAAMIIGAAHTAGVSKLLRESAYSFAVITPLALTDCDEGNNLEWNAYVRKTQGKSVDSSGLGSILDGRKKPQPMINRTWVQSKANAYYAVSLIARTAARGEKPPFGSLTILDKLEGVRIDKNTYRVEGSEVIFQASIEDENGKWQPMWFRVGCEAAGCNGKVLPHENPKSIERRIDELIAEAGGGGGKDGPPRNGDKTLASEDPEDKRKSGDTKDKAKKEDKTKKAREGAIEIDPGVYVIISKNRSEVERPVMLGAS